MRGCLIGDGDIKATTAFYAALPHIVDVLGRAKPRLREEALCYLGWAAGLAAFESPPAGIRAAYKVGLVKMGSMAAEALHAGVKPVFRRYLLAAFAVAHQEPIAALATVHLDTAFTCPRCGVSIDCPSCRLPLDGVSVFGRRVDQGFRK